MILKQVIQYTNAHAIEATWADENDVVIKCHAYSNHPEQMAMLRTDLGADAAQYESLIAEVEATYVPSEPSPPTPNQFSSLDFLDLFTETEQLAVAGAAMTNVQAKLWYDRTLAAEFVTLADPRTEAGLDALVLMNLLTVERKAEIVAAMVE